MKPVHHYFPIKISRYTVYKHFVMILEADQPPSFLVSSRNLRKGLINGYDPQHDERYNPWLKHFHGSSTAVIAKGT